MLRFLSGTVRFVDGDVVCVDVHGAGYAVRMASGDVARALASASTTTSIEVHVHTAVREDAIDLYGFFDELAYRVFSRLIEVSGVGPKSALAMLSGMDALDLVRAVVAGDEARLTKAPGVGKKTAQRIILELKDKLVKQGLASSPAPSTRAASSSTTLADLESALANLGYKPAQIERAKSAVGPLVDEGAPFDRLLLHALQSV